MLDSLPIHLRERTRLIGEGEISESATGDQFVLYWMRTAVRAEENPALDVARWVADRQGIPLLIYHAISQHYEYASDRHHLFMLQGARDVQRQFADLGLSYAFHLENPDDRQPHLVTLANKASVVVTEDMPVDPPRRFLKALKQKTETPIVSVDTACVAPMQLVKNPYTRAFKYRSATKDIYAERLTRAWPKMEVQTKSFDATKSFGQSQFPFESIDLQNADLADWVARCEIDHSVGPVVDTIGGSSAGYERWNKFKQEKLARYDKQRNNALLDGVSRMSPYLHYGMVSPFRIARETAEIDNGGAEKYLDELLVWRELAYAFCFYRDDHDQWSALPNWAQETLLQHSSDHRGKIYSWEQLARGVTDDKLWNAAQKSLLMHGELHNNVRMTWGKAILNWKQTPQEALSTIIDLNHRYALDGRDPASYGGILWCLGQFDRPFEPEQSTIGTVRPRPTSQHATRLNPEKYLAKVATPRIQSIPRVAVIGAGMSGVFAARTLQDHGLDVTVFEKSRGVGGRMSTRRTDSEATFDHGAQYFTARDHRFVRYVDSWIAQGVAAKWPNQELGADQKVVVLENGHIQSESKTDDRFVGNPAMNSICKHLANGVQIETKTRIAKVAKVDELVELIDEHGKSLGQFDRLVVSAPAAQTAELLAEFHELAEQVSKVEMKPCWATMVSFEQPITDQWVGAFLHGSFLSWAARNSTKPGRNSNTDNLVIHATPDWTQQHWEHDPNEVSKMMLEEFWRVSGIVPSPNVHIQSHRWKYAIPLEPSQVRCFSDSSAVVICCGDWASGSRVEGAFLSAMAAAGKILRALEPIVGDVK